ncbi:DEAD/DEAH box helicase family protein [Hoeflea sp.]|uniref:DEAD/DEAH box helicase family protein n=1 Tax=Hoeflea sp. TaxID=1940281 RepID=UPI0025C6B5B2|nr:DEAD/DEAH box helicase family protein [Hoeflea sp.]
MPLLRIENVDNFRAVQENISSVIIDDVIKQVKSLDESDEIEVWIQSILHDTNETPHGPSEIVDILTHKMTIGGEVGNAAFILKGKSFPTVRPKHVSHQIFRLERLKDLKTAVLAASGNILDEVKEEFISTASRLDLQYLILDAYDLARIFVSYGYLCPRDGKKIKGGKCDCGYTPKNRTSNILQQEANQQLKLEHRLGHTAGLVVLPTGAGKTRVAALDLLRVQPELAIYVAHSHEILEDAESELLALFAPLDVFRFSDKPSVDKLKRINLITIQSLSRNLDIFEGLSVDYMVIDEFHHAAAMSYRRAIDALKPAFLIGLTATPFRGDHKSVLELCNENIVVNFDMREGIELGVLCPYHYYGCFDNIDYTNISHNGNSYSIHDLEKALIIPERDRAIIEKWREKAQGKPTLAFCCSYVHAERVAHSFEKEGVSASVYLSITPRQEHRNLREEFRSGATKILCVVDILNEGVDLPFAECLLFLRPTESRRVFFQQLGRGLRHYVGKNHCTVIDFIGNFKNAYRIVEYQGLDPIDDEVPGSGHSYSDGMTSKDVLNLPAGCTVEFDERVMTVFGNQTLDPKYATRHNIGKILMHQYMQLERQLGRKPSRMDVDRQCLLGSDLYKMVFGSWRDFEAKLPS